MCLPTLFFLFNAPATTNIYTLSLHDALPISAHDRGRLIERRVQARVDRHPVDLGDVRDRRCHDPGLRGARLEELERVRSEEHTSELQSRQYLVCRLLLEKKKKKEVNDATDH